MKLKQKLFDMLISFCVCTTCIILLEGIMGSLFFPDVVLNYGDFFSPVLFGALSVLFGIVTESSKELSIRQVLIRTAIHLLLIEGMVFGLNYLVGVIFPPVVCITLAIGIAVVFVMVYVITWMNESKSAADFNQKLKEYQADKRNMEMPV